jgi:hypothetical protein
MADGTKFKREGVNGKAHQGDRLRFPRLRPVSNLETTLGGHYIIATFPRPPPEVRWATPVLSTTRHVQAGNLTRLLCHESHQDAGADLAAAMKAVNEPMRKKHLHIPAAKRAAAPAVQALILLDTKKIRKKRLDTYKRRRKTLEKLEADLLRFNENDKPEFEAYQARNFGALQTRQREAVEKVHLLMMRLEKISALADAHHVSPERLCHDLNAKAAPNHDFWAVLEDELDAWRQKIDYFRQNFNDPFTNEDDKTDGDGGDDGDGDGDGDGDFDFDLDGLVDEFFE